MNDFTKDELRTIISMVNASNPHGATYYSELRDKIQSMIDNYCERQCPSCGRRISIDDN